MRPSPVRSSAAAGLRGAADQGDEVRAERPAHRAETGEFRIVHLQGGADVARPDARRLHPPGEERLLDPGEILPGGILEALRQGHGPVVEVADDRLEAQAQLPRGAPAPVAIDELVAAGSRWMPTQFDGNLLALFSEAALQRLEGGRVVVRQAVGQG